MLVVMHLTLILEFRNELAVHEMRLLTNRIFSGRDLLVILMMLRTAPTFLVLDHWTVIFEVRWLIIFDDGGRGLLSISARVLCGRVKV